jgi:hypothetical protein
VDANGVQVVLVVANSHIKIIMAVIVEERLHVMYICGTHRAMTGYIL